MKNLHIARLAMTLAASTALNTLAPALAHAADAAADEAPPAPAPAAREGIADIIVTARKTSEKMQDVPVAVTALSGAKLQQQSIMSVQDVQFHVPGFVEYPEAQGGAPDFAIRGAKQQGVSGSQGGVAVYLDYIPLSSNYSIATATYDMQAVQVLKGPQGTLFGKNTTGGAIIFSPNKPTDKFEGDFKAEYGNYNRVDLTGMLNLPITEGVALRVAGRYVHRDAYITNVGASGSLGNFDSENNQSLRATLRIQPNEAITSDTMFDYYHQKQNPNHDRLVGYNAAFICSIYPNTCSGGKSTPYERELSLPLREVDLGDQQNINHGTYWGIANTTTVQLGTHTSLRNIISYRRDKLDSNETSDGVSIPLLNGLNNNRQRQFTEELDLMGKLFDDKLSYTVGIYYYDDQYDQRSDYQIMAPNTNTVDSSLSYLGEFAEGGGGLPQFPISAYGYSPISPSLQINDFGMKTIAVFGQATYKVDDKLSVTLGGRYNHDKGTFTSEQYQGYTDATLTTPLCNVLAYADASELVGACKIARSKLWQSFTWNASLNYKADPRTLLYVSAGRGYQAGGFNQQIRESQYRTFSPEVVFTLEAGLKKDWHLGGRPIRTNIAIFRSNYKNQQRVENGTYSDGLNFIATFNAASSTMWGGEAEISYLPTPQLEISLAYSYINAKYDYFKSPDVANLGGQDLSSLAIGATPKHTFNTTVSYWVPTNNRDGKLKGSVTAYARSGAYYNDLAQSALTYQASYAIFNARLDLIKTLPFDVGVWVNNLADKNYSLFKFDNLNSLGYASVFLAPPRTFGVDASIHF
ncbi:MAG TPA: TonB-dependent receptor [Novosphingobium sp.]|nr:TonB-dependent receptor [Novosphingobium sp.]